MQLRLPEVGFARGVHCDLVAQPLELTAADVLEILALGRGGRGFVEINGDLIALPYLRAGVAGHGDAVLEGDAADGDEGDDIGRADARMRALMMGKVDQFRGATHAADGSLLHGFALAGEGDDAAVVVGVHLAVE